MSFLKIRDPFKREQTVKEFIALKKRIHDNQLAEKEGRLKYQQHLSKFFRPVTEAQKETIKNIRGVGDSRINRLTTKLDEFPTLLVFEGHKFSDEEEIELEKYFNLLDLKGFDEHISKINVNPFELNQLRRFKNEEEVDLKYGFYEKDEKLFIGDKKVDILSNNFYIDDNEFEGTPGLWELIVAKDPKDIFTEKDLNNYKKIMIITNNLYKDNNPNINLSKSRSTKKWKDFLNFFWVNKDKIRKEISLNELQDRVPIFPYQNIPLIASPIKGNEEKYHPHYFHSSGSGITVIPSDPNALLERFDLLMASKGAGHTGVRNELVSICDELKRQRVLNTKAYKKLMSKLKK